ncbi:translocation/assembly module TamB domain-containing protein [bacterium]|nr:translocation/assembly module TamB domain-containing protein [bacterium]MBU1916953.1 translocation/assembly module TamB domain-containing protein [bacterium]
MTEKKPEQPAPDMPQTTPEQDKTKPLKKKHKRFYHFRTFWIILLIIIGYAVTAGINWALNDRAYQLKAADYIYQKTGTKLEFSDVHFNLFTGRITGADLFVHSEKNKVKTSLKEFTLKYNPYYLWIGRLKLTEIIASEFYLDTSEMIVAKKKQANLKNVPTYLKHIYLSKAQIKKFNWKQPKETILKFDNLKLTSKFGSAVHTSPLRMEIDTLEYRGKHHIFFRRMNFDGFFLFDFSKPFIFDQTKLSARLEIEDTLLAFYRTPKPWLTDKAWDDDLEPLLKQYYPDKIPDDHTYLSVKDAFIDFHKSKQVVMLNRFRINIHNAALEGKGRWQLQNNDFDVAINTADPIPLSKLPLGQSKFRQAFEKFTIDLKAKGRVKSLEENDVSLDLKTRLIGNLANPIAGDVTGSIKGKIKNGELHSNNIELNVAQGKLLARTNTSLRKLTTQTSFTASNIDVHTVVGFFSSIKIPCIAQASGMVTGKLNNPNIYVDMTSDNAMYQFLNFGKARGKLTIQNKKLDFTINSVGSDMGQSMLRMDVNNVFKPMIQVMHLTSKFENMNIKKLLNSKRMDGVIGGEFNLTRNKGIVSAKGHFLAKDFTFFEEKVGFIDFIATINERTALIKPITVELSHTEKTLISPTGLTFDFDDYGYRFSGTVIPGLKMSGYYEKINEDIVHMKFHPQDLNLDIFAQVLPVTPEQSGLTGDAELTYHTKDPFLSKMQSQISKFYIHSQDGDIELNNKAGFNYHDKAFVFRGFDVTLGQGRVVLDGAVGFESNSALKIKGGVDFTPIVDYNPFISETETPIDVDLTLKGNIFKPSVFGKVTLNKDVVKFRNVEAELSNMMGVLRFNDNKIHFDDFTFDYDDAPMTLKGYITTDYEKVTGADLLIKGNEVPFYLFGDLSLLIDLDMRLKGSYPMTLSGNMNIVEGTWTRNFVITNFFIKPIAPDLLEEEKETLAGLPLTTRYNVKITNTGDMLIQNNLADLELNLDLDMQGSFEKPDLIGQMDFLGGKIHALGITFDDATGFAQFKKGSGIFPLVSLTARREIQGYNIAANMDGKAENLRLRLYATPALDHREILSLVFYGQTPDQLTESDRQNFTRTAAISQLATILADPLQKFYGIDHVQVSARHDRPQETVQRLAVGKKLSDRFDISFTTDLGINDPERAFELRYQVLDNFYLIVAKDVVGRNRYRFDVSWHFEAY